MGLGKAGRPGHAPVTECVFPDCVEAVTSKLDLPMCDRHLVKVYRSVQVLMDVEEATPHKPAVDRSDKTA